MMLLKSLKLKSRLKEKMNFHCPKKKKIYFLRSNSKRQLTKVVFKNLAESKNLLGKLMH